MLSCGRLLCTSRVIDLVRVAGVCAAISGGVVLAQSQPNDLGLQATASARIGQLEQLDAAGLAKLLDDADVSIRQRAEDVLSGREDVSLGVIEDLLRGELSPEALLRLERVGLSRFVRTPRGALGVQFDTTTIGRTVIESTTPGFDSGRVFKPGDEILAIEGETIQHELVSDSGFGGRSPIRPLVISRDPGQRVKVTINRRGEIMDVELELGSFDRLRQPQLGGFGQSLADFEYQAGWSNRLSRVRKGQGVAALDWRFDDEAWHDAGESKRPKIAADDRQQMQHQMQQAGRIPSVVAGGQPRIVGQAGGSGGYGAPVNLGRSGMFNQNMNGRVAIFQGGVQVEVQPGVWMNDKGAAEGDLQGLRASIKTQQLMIEQWRNMAQRAQDPQSAQMINEQVRGMEKTLKDFQQQLADLRQGPQKPGQKSLPGVNGKEGPGDSDRSIRQNR
jgi:hypothetical protein